MININNKKSGFTLIELMAFFVFLTILLIAATPVITKRAKDIPKRLSHGKFICYPDHYEIYNASRKIDSVAGECKFTPPRKDALYRIEVVGGGAGGLGFWNAESVLVDNTANDLKQTVFDSSGVHEYDGATGFKRPSKDEWVAIMSGAPFRLFTNFTASESGKPVDRTVKLLSGFINYGFDFTFEENKSGAIVAPYEPVVKDGIVKNATDLGFCNTLTYQNLRQATKNNEVYQFWIDNNLPVYGYSGQKNKEKIYSEIIKDKKITEPLYNSYPNDCFVPSPLEPYDPMGKRNCTKEEIKNVDNANIAINKKIVEFCENKFAYQNNIDNANSLARLQEYLSYNSNYNEADYYRNQCFNWTNGNYISGYYNGYKENSTYKGYRPECAFVGDRSTQFYRIKTEAQNRCGDGYWLRCGVTYVPENVTLRSDGGSGGYQDYEPKDATKSPILTITGYVDFRDRTNGGSVDMSGSDENVRTYLDNLFKGSNAYYNIGWTSRAGSCTGFQDNEAEMYYRSGDIENEIETKVGKYTIIKGADGKSVKSYDAVKAFNKCATNKVRAVGGRGGLMGYDKDTYQLLAKTKQGVSPSTEIVGSAGTGVNYYYKVMSAFDARLHQDGYVMQVWNVRRGKIIPKVKAFTYIQGRKHKYGRGGGAAIPVVKYAIALSDDCVFKIAPGGKAFDDPYISAADLNQYREDASSELSCNSGTLKIVAKGGEYRRDVLEKEFGTFEFLNPDGTINEDKVNQEEFITSDEGEKTKFVLNDVFTKFRINDLANNYGAGGKGAEIHDKCVRPYGYYELVRTYEDSPIKYRTTYNNFHLVINGKTYPFNKTRRWEIPNSRVCSEGDAMANPAENGKPGIIIISW